MRRDLEKDVVGRRIKEVEVKGTKNAMRSIRRHKTRKEFTSGLVGRKIAKVERRGKYLMLTLDSGNVLVVHFGMSGQFQRGTGRVALPAHTHVVFTFQQGGDLRFVDPRTFGEMFVSGVDEVGKIKELQHLAIDPLDQVFTWPTFQYLLAQRAMKMKPLMMDQKFISGLGNIYSDEVLFHAGLRFDRVSDTLVVAGGPPPLPGDPGGPAGGHQTARHDAGGRGLRGPVRQAGRVPARAEGLRSRRPAVSPLPHRRSRPSRSPSATPTTARSARADARAQVSSAPASRIRVMACSPSSGDRFTGRIAARTTCTG